ncbi:hypothetical protein COV61_04065 [Candidatus Micrarchaeota archaeon CG11_big_fil_rev_8_21_14_0_20_47_5]|nr:MAG: hypothetical protein AUJ17_05815 [Candidatus Micrarchaeota archaeon CG1_02_47_40]PIN83103.1 MAG: hypothetical protein COV61_04065 [Candidatus Micrarchaeota archaeon CG11_big_fil_rev_8_21_14_0_20_47_5]
MRGRTWFCPPGWNETLRGFHLLWKSEAFGFDLRFKWKKKTSSKIELLLNAIPLRNKEMNFCNSS